MHLSRCSAPSMTTWAGGKRAMQGLVLASDCRGQSACRRVYGVVSVVLVCLPAGEKGPGSLPCVRTSGARSQYTRTGGKVHSFLNKKRKKNNIMTILQKVIF